MCQRGGKTGGLVRIALWAEGTARAKVYSLGSVWPGRGTERAFDCRMVSREQEV